MGRVQSTESLGGWNVPRLHAIEIVTSSEKRRYKDRHILVKNVDALPLRAIRRYSMGSFLLNVVNDGIIGDTSHTHGTRLLSRYLETR
jgi:hypothetical protein